MSHTADKTSWRVLLTERAIVLRGLRFAVVVGCILIAINHGDALLRGELDADRVGRMLLTMAVPYCVSVFSSASALRKKRETDC